MVEKYKPTVAPDEDRCELTCPHGDRCRLEKGHEEEGFGCSHLGCDCNEPNVRKGSG